MMTPSPADPKWPAFSIPAGLVIGAPRSGGGKTTVTLGLLRALSDRGHRVQPFKCGPDYIDPAFHRHAAKRASFNLDSWALRASTFDYLTSVAADTADFCIAEGLMGYFDGVEQKGTFGTGASADLSRRYGWPLILVLDVSGQSQTAAALAHGFATYRDDISVAGVILNKVGSERHIRLVKSAIEDVGLNYLGALPRRKDIVLPERHLGLVVAEETDDLEQRLGDLAEFISSHVDIDAIPSLATGINEISTEANKPNTSSFIKPPGQKIALARDAAFSFVYPHVLEFWRRAGAEITTFSPLADETPASDADVIWLPGGYPELHAGRLANNTRFLSSLRTMAQTTQIHGECGGYMVLGTGLVDKDGNTHEMAGLLDLETSFQRRRMSLGYRRAHLHVDCPIGSAGAEVSGHEFHYATVLKSGDTPLAEISNAQGDIVSETGAKRGLVSGSFFHFLDKLAP